MSSSSSLWWMNKRIEEHAFTTQRLTEKRWGPGALYLEIDECLYSAVKKKRKKEKEEVVCLPLSVITDRSVDIFNGLHSSLSVAFLSTPLTYFCSSVLFSIFPLLPILCLSIDRAFITATGHLFLLCVSVLFFVPILFSTPAPSCDVPRNSSRYNGPKGYQRRHQTRECHSVFLFAIHGSIDKSPLFLHLNDGTTSQVPIFVYFCSHSLSWSYILSQVIPLYSGRSVTASWLFLALDSFEIFCHTSHFPLCFSTLYRSPWCSVITRSIYLGHPFLSCSPFSFAISILNNICFCLLVSHFPANADCDILQFWCSCSI